MREGLRIVADDLGYARGYDRGIAEAAGAGALDAVSAMVLRDPDPGRLRGADVATGLHLEAPGPDAPTAEGRSTSRSPLELSVDAVRTQLDRFRDLFGDDPAHVDGHHNCHARGGGAASVARIAAARGLWVRSVDESHRSLLRSMGVATADRTIGRLDPREPALPAEIEAVLVGAEPAPGLTEWVVHPGHRDPEAGSRYDVAREEDLELVLELAAEPRLLALRRAAPD